MVSSTRNVLICSCEDTMPLDAEAARRGCGGAPVTTARQLVARFGAPDVATALPAAEEEIAFAASLADHPAGMLAAVSRRCEAGVVHEAFRALRPSDGPAPLRVFDVRQMAGEGDALADHIDLLAMSRRECR